MTGAQGWLDGMPWLQPREGAARRWDVRKAASYAGSQGDVWTIPVGFSTDLASIPWPMRWLVDTWGMHTGAALLHDWLCAIARGQVASCAELGPTCACRGALPRYLTRKDADGLFRRTLRLGSIPAPLAWLMYLAVRIGSGFSGGMSRDEWAMCALVAPLGLLAVLVSLPLLLVRGLVDGLGRITERLRG